jgi:glyoxylase-like metal-dependent hydrolase (beta-lactamase superfamily II)
VFIAAMQGPMAGGGTFAACCCTGTTPATALIPPGPGATVPPMQTATADSWYSVSSLEDDVTYICEPFVTEFFRCNIWHVRGRDRDLLVDSGMGIVPLREHIPTVTEKPLIAVASHTHYDHIGAHHEFEERWVHKAEADILGAPTRDSTLAGYVEDGIYTQLPPKPYSSADYAVKAAPATRLLDDGDMVDLGDRHFEVVHTPGHSPGGIMLFERETGILFSGDIVYDGPLITDAYHSDLDDYIATMKRIHYPSFDGARYRALIRAFLDEQGT